LSVSEASTTSIVIREKYTHTGSKMKKFATASLGVLVAGNIDYENVSETILLQLIDLLTQYRDLLIKLKVQ